jgi:hypothetical protein
MRRPTKKKWSSGTQTSLWVKIAQVIQQAIIIKKPQSD